MSCERLSAGTAAGVGAGAARSWAWSGVAAVAESRRTMQSFFMGLRHLGRKCACIECIEVEKKILRRELSSA
jgi:hypothetical protein